jgi:transposase InsO family protein
VGKGITQSREEALTARNRLIWKMAQEGRKTVDLAAAHGVSVRTIQRVKRATKGRGKVIAARRPGPRRGSVNSATPAAQVHMVCEFRRTNPHKGHHYCHYMFRRKGLRVPAPVTIWRIWRRLGLMGRRKRRQRRREWLAMSSDPGYFQLDTMYLAGDRFAFVALETHSRWAYAKICRSRDSAQAAVFLDELRKTYPGTVRGLQTDNGSEFAGHFKSSCKAAGLPHVHAWVNCPDQNGKVERFNRILRDETMLGADDHTIPDSVLIANLISYLHFYNYDRAHSALDWNSPALYLASHSCPGPAFP